MWQVKFAPYKTKLLHVTRSSGPLNLDFNGRTLAPQDEVEVLGVTYDCRLTFKSHIERLAREASLRRMSWLLDNRGLEVLYKAKKFAHPWSMRALPGAALPGSILQTI
ncbi:hypothetical protein E2C01_047142 [Portunus trituberculatus]|uniref:Uncharacterized protein n=1 Tax=Portunus trituberculatus TaxID=210409 RepID=A0A5B7G7Q9_PORTR|nr:hypothetical protein [Portunus trituberculatus]